MRRTQPCPLERKLQRFFSGEVCETSSGTGYHTCSQTGVALRRSGRGRMSGGDDGRGFTAPVELGDGGQAAWSRPIAPTRRAVDATRCRFTGGAPLRRGDRPSVAAAVHWRKRSSSARAGQDSRETFTATVHGLKYGLKYIDCSLNCEFSVVVCVVEGLRWTPTVCWPAFCHAIINEY